MNIKVKLNLKGNLQHYGKSAGDIVTIPLEDYVKGVVAAEIGNSHLEACKAQAVAARTYAYNNAKNGSAISDSASSAQAFIAARIDNRTGYPNSHRGVEETAGQILAYHGTPIGRNALYSSANNGSTKNKRYKWPDGGDVPYLILRPDNWTYQELQRREMEGIRIRYGHGVGMSQYGIMYAAKQGVGYREMLAFYYPGTEIIPTKVMNANAIKMTDYARSKVGGKYVYAASGPVNFDCSGFTKRIAQQLGYDFFHGATTSYLRGFQTGDPKRYGYWAASGTIDTLPPDAVAFLFNQDKDSKRHLVMAHTGYYDGATGNVIQAGGYGGRGVWEGKLDRRRWTHWAILKESEIGGNEEPMASVLRRGSVGVAVKEMQQALLDRGFDLGRWGADGKFGGATETAVMAFQRLNGLPVNGAWSDAERAKLIPEEPLPDAGTTDKERLIYHLEQALILARR